MSTRPTNMMTALSGRTPEQWAEEVVERILCLRTLTAHTGTKTTKTQNDLLQSIPGDVLTLVAVKLKAAFDGGTK